MPTWPIELPQLPFAGVGAQDVDAVLHRMHTPFLTGHWVEVHYRLQNLCDDAHADAFEQAIANGGRRYVGGQLGSAHRAKLT